MARPIENANTQQVCVRIGQDAAAYLYKLAGEKQQGVGRVLTEIIRDREERPMKTIDAYRITITRAQRMDETGTRYSLDPWQGDTREYEGYDEPARVSVPDDAEIVDLREETGSRMIVIGDHDPILLDDAVRLHIAHPHKR